MSINPMQSAHDAPLCKAKSKRTGKACRAPAVRCCRVCRMHGAGGGAPSGKQNGNYRHGTRTMEAIQAVRYINLLSRGGTQNSENGVRQSMSAFVRIPDSSRTLRHVPFVPIVLKNSKIAGLRKSRKCRMWANSAPARLCKIDTSASGRFCGD
jgi:hypothetical protein